MARLKGKVIEHRCIMRKCPEGKKPKHELTLRDVEEGGGLWYVYFWGFIGEGRNTPGYCIDSCVSWWKVFNEAPGDKRRRVEHKNLVEELVCES